VLQHFDVLVLGGGIVGAAIADCLSSRAPELRLGLIEKGEIGAGSTSRSAAAFRHQFSSRGNILLSKLSYEVFRNFRELYACDVEVFRENGYLFLYTKPALFHIAERRALAQQREGVPVEILDAAEVNALPQVAGFFDQDVLVGATFCHRDGFVDPLLAAQTFHRAAEARGLVSLRQEVLGLLRDQAGRVIGVRTDQGELRAGIVVNAMGWSANKVLGAEQLALPILPVKRYLYVTSPVRGIKVDGLPMIVLDLEPYMRPEPGNSLLMGWDALPRVPSQDALAAIVDYAALEAVQDQIDPDFTNDEYGLEIRVRMAEAVPLMESDQLKLFQETCGYYQITADDKPILDHDPRAEGLIHAIGFSGHGVMHAPAAAQVIGDLITGEQTVQGLEPGTFAIAPLLDHRVRPDPEHMSI